MSDSEEIIEIKWPWTMMPLEFSSDWIEAVKKGLSPEAPIYGKDIFVSAIREDGNILLIENDTDGTYLIVEYEKDPQKRLLI